MANNLLWFDLASGDGFVSFDRDVGHFEAGAYPDEMLSFRLSPHEAVSLASVLLQYGTGKGVVS